jgi:PKD repeat protein
MSIAGRQAFLALCLAPFPVPASQAASQASPPEPVLAAGFAPRPVHRARFEYASDPRLARLRAAGAVRWELDYGGFLLAGVDERAGGGAAALLASGIEWRDDEDRILFDGFVIDATRPREALARIDPASAIGDPLDASLDPDAGLYVLQFRGPARDEWLGELAAAGATVVQPVPMNAYVVRVEPRDVSLFAALAAERPEVQFLGVYEPAFRMTPRIRAMAATGPGGSASVTVQLVLGPHAEAAMRDLENLAARVVASTTVGPYRNVRCELDPVYFRWLAAHPGVFAIEERGTLARRSTGSADERQGQIVAGNVSGASPSGPDYLAWLAAKGFTSSQFTAFSVNVVDDATSLTGHPDLASGRVAFAQNPSSQSGSQGGHGFLNAHIVAGLNSGTGSANEDAGAYNYGLGIAPWARVGSTAIFGPGFADSSTYESAAYNLGARISTNSWGYVDAFNNPIPDYDSSAQEYDSLVRDARSGQAGNQQYTIVFSAGNDGPGGNTVSTPATAKNVITVGASENNRQTGTDGCGVSNSGANDLRDLIGFSSHGPVNSAGGDGRLKPEIVAPGTHVQAGVPQSSYNGSSVCNQYWPSGQTLYGWSSGTSHSAPAVAGASALVRQWFLNSALSAPSPAMVKAVLVSGAAHMTGANANDTLPSNGQGFGRMFLERAFDGVARQLFDQTNVFGSTGQSFVASGTVSDLTKPLRVTLVWTDAPGPTSGAPYVNNLDLTVQVGASTYRGNVFSGASSTTGGSADIRNNTESVFLPAGTSGSVTVTVSATAIGGDGVPGNGDSTDQDFALVVYNVTSEPPPVAEFTGSPTSGVAPLLVSFTNQSTGAITSHAWTFGDGGTSTAASPSHTYAAAGTYTVALTETGPGGSDTRTRTDYVVVSEPPPVADFTGSPTAGVVPLDVSFSNQSTGAITSHSWTFGDGATSTDASPSHTYAAAGTYTVALTETGPGGSDTRTRTDYVVVSEPPPVADFTGSPLAGLAPLLVDFTNLSTGAISGHAWSFGDGGTSSAASPSHTYLAAGTYTVVLTETGPGGTSVRTRTDYVVVDEPPPVADFTASPLAGTAPLAVDFTDLSSGAITSWTWTFGDGEGASSASPSHVYAAPGTYTVELAVSSPGGSDTRTRIDYVVVSEPPPVAAFSLDPTRGLAPLTVEFTDLSTGAVTSRAWDFGDGGSSTSASPSHAYAVPGTFTVSLTVTGPGGSDAESAVVTVLETPAHHGGTGAKTRAHGGPPPVLGLSSSGPVGGLGPGPSPAPPFLAARAALAAGLLPPGYPLVASPLPPVFAHGDARVLEALAAASRSVILGIGARR